jgi:iron complex outermembrane receptor protein
MNRRSDRVSVDCIGFELALRPLACACTAALALGSSLAQAQQEGPVEEVTVTGTLIERSGMNAPTPVTTVTSDDLALMAPGNMIEALSQLPLFYGNTSSDAPGNFFTSPGSGNLNLRGIGTNRTLVLLNGRRVVSSTRFGGTDINVFPEAMISRVESVTGGASAQYGTDAITGVTNFILDTEFDGVRGHLQGGSTSRGDADNWEASFAFGSDIGERFHVLFSTEQYQRDGVFTYDGRDWYKAWGLVNNADPNGPRQLVRPYVVSTTATFDGLISAPGTPLHGLNFNSEGTAATPFVRNPLYTGTSQSIAGGTGSGDFIGADRPNVVPDYERSSSFLYFDFDVNDHLKLFVQGLYGTSTSTTQGNIGQFQFVFSPMTIYSGNAFLPSQIQQIMDDNDIASFTLNRMGHSSDLGLAGATNVEDITMSQGTIGLEADLAGGGPFDGWRVNAYYQQGSNKTKANQDQGIRLDRIHMAHDAVIDPVTGATVCHVTLVSGLYPDCVPLNPFGRGNMSQAAIDWVTGFDEGQYIDTPLYYTQSGYDLGLRDSYVSESGKITRTWIDQDVFEFRMDGEVFDDRSAGAMSIAFGAGWRKDEMNQIMRSPALPDGNLDTGRPVPANDPVLGIRGQPGGDVNNSVAIQYSKVPNIRGKMDVTEYFGELYFPVVANSKLDLSAAARHADYYGSGGIWAYKLGISSQLTDSFRIRATGSHDVRAGTLADRYDQTGSAGSVMDPFMDNAQTNIFQAGGGNPNIRPEEADTISYGIVYQPNWADGLSMSIDTYDVSLTDAISSLTSQQILDQCFASGGNDAQFCDRIFRLPNGSINLIQATVLNVAKAKVSGIDVEIGYRKAVDWFGGGEVIGFRLFSSHLKENSTQGFQSPKIDRAGQLNLFEYPKDKIMASLNYTRGPLGLYLQGRRVDSGYRDVLAVEGVDIDDNTIDAVTYVDLNLRYAMDAGEGTWEFYGAVNNLTDQDPPVVPNFGLFGASANQTNAGLHDLLGRRYTFGISFNF